MSRSSLTIGLADLGRHPSGHLLPGALERQADQPALRRPARRHGFVRVLILSSRREKRQARATSIVRSSAASWPRNRRAIWRGRLQVALGVGLQPPAGLVDGGPLADAGQHVLQHAPVGVVIEDGVGGDHRRAGALGHGRQPVQPAPGRRPATGARPPDKARPASAAPAASRASKAASGDPAPGPGRSSPRPANACSKVSRVSAFSIRSPRGRRRAAAPPRSCRATAGGTGGRRRRGRGGRRSARSRR
jgi:hypothetical protein